jgi:hypothetical protein
MQSARPVIIFILFFSIGLWLNVNGWLAIVCAYFGAMIEFFALYSDLTEWEDE